MMNDLISRSALLEKEWLTEAVDGYPIRVVEVGDILDAPTIDARPVIHGRWKYPQDAYICSICGNKAHSFRQGLSEITYLSDYCPYCGAIMGAKSFDFYRNEELNRRIAMESGEATDE